MPSCVASGALRGSSPARSVGIEQRPRCVLGLLDVRFVEWIDLEQATRRRRRHFPPEEFRAERVEARHMDRHDRRACRAHSVDGAVIGADTIESNHDSDPVAACCGARGLACDRDDPFALFAGALRDQLFDPQAKRLQAWRQAPASVCRVPDVPRRP